MDMLTPSRTPQEITKSRRIGVLIYPGCDILDLCGPCDTFSYADFWLRRFGRTDEPGYQCDFIAATPGPVRTMCGLEIVATHGYPDIGDGLDTLIVAGGAYAEQACKDTGARRVGPFDGPAVRRVASVCTGAFILAAAGLLHQRRVTTHWMFSDVLATEYPSI